MKFWLAWMNWHSFPLIEISTLLMEWLKRHSFALTPWKKFCQAKLQISWWHGWNTKFFPTYLRKQIQNKLLGKYLKQEANIRCYTDDTLSWWHGYVPWWGSCWKVNHLPWFFKRNSFNSNLSFADGMDETTLNLLGIVK